MIDYTGKKVCFNCKHATPNMKFANLDLEGNPTLVNCPFEKFARIRSEAACSHFEMK